MLPPGCLRLRAEASFSPKGIHKSAQTSEVVCQGFFEKKSTRCPQFFSQPSHLLPGRVGRKLLDGRPQGRVATLQRFQVLLFVIGNPVLPTTKQDTDPFVSHHPNGGPVAVAPGALTPGERSSPPPMRGLHGREIHTRLAA